MCVMYIDGELVCVLARWAAPHVWAYPLSYEENALCVSQHDGGVNSQAEVAAHKQKHMEG